ncbi:MAG: hypothetical protein ACFCUN_02970 [Hyphomicrobiaceae bacterium]
MLIARGLITLWILRIGIDHCGRTADGIALSDWLRTVQDLELGNLSRYRLGTIAWAAIVGEKLKGALR